MAGSPSGPLTGLDEVLADVDAEVPLDGAGDSAESVWPSSIMAFEELTTLGPSQTMAATGQSSCR